MIKGVNHVGISVSGLERSIEFYRQAFGMEVVATLAFDGATEGGNYQAILGIQGATGRAALLRGASLQLELFEFARPAPKRSDPHRPVCDHGITHFCIDVTDVHQEYERLRALGVSFHCAPLSFFGAVTATYGRDPDGNVFELIEQESVRA